MTSTRDTEGRALYRLMTWLSPSYPVGAYTYSHGLEYAVEAGWVTDRASTQGWVGDIVSHGGGFSDAVLLAAAYEAGGNELSEVAELALAFAPTAELALESKMQGNAFLEMTSKAWPQAGLERLISVWGGPYPYPVVVGVAARGAGIALLQVLEAYLHAFAANLVSAAVRLIPLGQTDGQLIMAALESVVAAAALEAVATPPDDLATTAFMADVASMKHETQYTRLFRS
ncbi:urease accessory protein UreF [Kordiimonas aestuarii]|uniref:urease accessory protein UreF n=1 Tax=Kordiimonas aestuarii TaxID=1005925 RepID=UPI0021D399BA|nr:urease accessory protein UreF [Kordiimonas aestuarii]